MKSQKWIIRPPSPVGGLTPRGAAAVEPRRMLSWRLLFHLLAGRCSALLWPWASHAKSSGGQAASRSDHYVAPWPVDERSLPARRLFTVHLLTPNVLHEYSRLLDAFVSHYYARTSNHTVLLVTPQQDMAHVANFLSRIDGTAHDQRASAESHVAAHYGGASTLQWRYGGVDFLLKGVGVSVPDQYSGMQATCNGRNWTREYALYSGAFFVAQLIWLPLLDKADFYVKCDTDVRFLQPMPFDLGLRLGSLKAAVIAHTGFDPGKSRNCERGILQVLAAFRTSHGVSGLRSGSDGTRGVAQQMARWCRANALPANFYGNFVAYRSAFMRSAPVQALSKHLYYEAGRGYFESRWGDQASPMAFVCHMLENVALTGDERIVHIEHLRNVVFRHGRKKTAAKPKGKGAKRKAPVAPLVWRSR